MGQGFNQHYFQGFILSMGQWIHHYITLKNSAWGVMALSKQTCWKQINWRVGDHPTSFEHRLFNGCNTIYVQHNIDWLVQKRRNSSALAMELHLSCTNPSICSCYAAVINKLAWWLLMAWCLFGTRPSGTILMTWAPLVYINIHCFFLPINQIKNHSVFSYGTNPICNSFILAARFDKYAIWQVPLNPCL